MHATAHESRGHAGQHRGADRAGQNHPPAENGRPRQPTSPVCREPCSPALANSTRTAPSQPPAQSNAVPVEPWVCSMASAPASLCTARTSPSRAHGEEEAEIRGAYMAPTASGSGSAPAATARVLRPRRRMQQRGPGAGIRPQHPEHAEPDADCGDHPGLGGERGKGKTVSRRRAPASRARPQASR